MKKQHHPHPGAIAMRTGAALLAAAMALAGCAVQPNGRGGVIVGVDNAQLFGTTVATFQLRDGTEGTLRRDPNNGPFSIKLNGSMRVVPLQNAISARLARVVPMGARTVLVLETQERGCAYKYEVLSIEGSDVLHWSLGNCNDRPRVELAEGGQALYFDFPAYDRLQRQIYTDSRMLNAGTLAAPGMDLRTRPFADAGLHAPSGAALPYQSMQQPAPSGQGAQKAGPSRPGAPPNLTPAPGLPRSAGIQDTDNGGRFIPAPPHRAGAIAAAPPSVPAAPSAASAAPAASQAAARRTAGGSGAAATRTATPAPMTFPAQEMAPVHLDLRK